MHQGLQRSPWTAIAVVPLFALLLAAVVSTASAQDRTPPVPLPIEQMRAAVYTKEFAKRFALPEPEPGTEPEGGIQAMEFAVEPSSNAPYYYCKLYLYIDNKLSIAYPEGETGVAHLPGRHTQLMTFDAQTRWLALSENDRRHFSKRGLKYANLTWLATPDYIWQKQGASASMFYEEYHRDLFPGLAYLKIDMACPAYSWVDKSNSAQIWLKREGAKDYGKQLKVDSEDFLKFAIPQSFYRRIIGWTKEAARFNREVIDQKSKSRSN